MHGSFFSASNKDWIIKGIHVDKDCKRWIGSVCTG